MGLNADASWRWKFNEVHEEPRVTLALTSLSILGREGTRCNRIKQNHKHFTSHLDMLNKSQQNEQIRICNITPKSIRGPTIEWVYTLASSYTHILDHGSKYPADHERCCTWFLMVAINGKVTFHGQLVASTSTSTNSSSRWLPTILAQVIWDMTAIVYGPGKQECRPNPKHWLVITKIKDCT